MWRSGDGEECPAAACEGTQANVQKRARLPAKGMKRHPVHPDNAPGPLASEESLEIALRRAPREGFGYQAKGGQLSPPPARTSPVSAATGTGVHEDGVNTAQSSRLATGGGSVPSQVAGPPFHVR